MYAFIFLFNIAFFYTKGSQILYLFTMKICMFCNVASLLSDKKYLNRKIKELLQQHPIITNKEVLNVVH